MRWCWVNLQCRGVLLIWIIVGQGPTALAVGTGGKVGVCLDIFTLIYWETVRYRLKYCLKGPLSPTGHLVARVWSSERFIGNYRSERNRVVSAQGRFNSCILYPNLSALSIWISFNSCISTSPERYVQLRLKENKKCKSET